MIKFLFPSYTRSAVMQPAVYCVTALISLVLDVGKAFIDETGITGSFLAGELIVTLMLVLASWFQLFEFVYLSCILAFTWVGLIDSYGPFNFGLLAVLVM